ncbi:MAG: hypothetical protein CL955_02070 [Erythrobacteraceae bacterium]|nr:hypothetical protein [Erythrobacteraceae bacterium]
MHRRRVLTALALTATLALAPGAAQADVNWNRIDLPAERTAIETFQFFDQRLQDVGWQLARGNADYCDNAIPSIGLQLQDMASYGSPEVARRALGLKRDFAVQTAARGSPAAATGAFAANREVIRLGSFDPNEWPASPRLNWQRLKLAHDHVDELLESEGSVTVGFAGGETVEVAPVTVCATRFELAGRGDDAVATGDRVVIGIKFPGFAYEEQVFAGVVAHELAHNLLGHKAWLDRHGRSRSNTRRTEREADRLMPWLLANAGYDPVAAEEFLETYKPTSGSVLFIPGTHQKWRDRAEAVAGEVPQIRALTEAHGSADWRTHFRREIDPQQSLDD